MDKLKPVSVTLLNQTLSVNCPAGAEAQLLEAARYLDQKMHEIAENTRTNGPERIALMAALNIANELCAFRHQKEAYIQTVTQQIESLQNKIDEALMETTQVE